MMAPTVPCTFADLALAKNAVVDLARDPAMQNALRCLCTECKVNAQPFFEALERYEEVAVENGLELQRQRRR